MEFQELSKDASKVLKKPRIKTEPKSRGPTRALGKKVLQRSGKMEDIRDYKLKENLTKPILNGPSIDRKTKTTINNTSKITKIYT